MSSPPPPAGAPEIEACFNTLPPELKAHIVYFIAKQQSLDQFNLDDDDSDDGDASSLQLGSPSSSSASGSAASELVEDGEADVEGVIPTTAWSDPPKKHSLTNVSLVSRELAQLAFPYIWKRVDFTDRSTEDVLTFHSTILPRHARHVRAIKFEQFHDADELIEPARVKEVMPSLASAEAPLSEERRAELATVASQQPWRLRSYIFAALIHALPRLEVIFFDLAPFLDRGESADEAFAAPAVDERVANPLLRAIEANGARMTDLTLSTVLTALDGRQLGAFLRSCPNLLRLSIELSLRPGGAGDLELVEALTTLIKLESLTVNAAAWVNGSFARANWSAPLRILALGSCTELWVEDLRTLVEKFSATLDTLDVDDTPAPDVMSDEEEPTRSPEERKHAQGKDWGRPWRLPNLEYLVIGCEQDPSFLDAFRESPIHTFEIGYCPLIPAKVIEAFISLGADREGKARLREVRIQADADLTDGQREGIEVLCFAKGIQCKIEEGGNWESDYTDSDQEAEVEVVDEWTDEDDEDGWEMNDGDEAEDDEEGFWVSDEE